jgi:hypothetical protein
LTHASRRGHPPPPHTLPAGDATRATSNEQQADPAGVDPAGTDQGGDADSGDAGGTETETDTEIVIEPRKDDADSSDS